MSIQGMLRCFRGYSRPEEVLFIPFGSNASNDEEGRNNGWNHATGHLRLQQPDSIRDSRLQISKMFKVLRDQMQMYGRHERKYLRDKRNRV